MQLTNGTLFINFSFTYFKYKNEIYSKEDNFIEIERTKNRKKLEVYFA